MKISHTVQCCTAKMSLIHAQRSGATNPISWPKKHSDIRQYILRTNPKHRIDFGIPYLKNIQAVDDNWINRQTTQQGKWPLEKINRFVNV